MEAVLTSPNFGGLFRALTAMFSRTADVRPLPLSLAQVADEIFTAEDLSDLREALDLATDDERLQKRWREIAKLDRELPESLDLRGLFSRCLGDGYERLAVEGEALVGGLPRLLDVAKKLAQGDSVQVQEIGSAAFPVELARVAAVVRRSSVCAIAIERSGELAKRPEPWVRRALAEMLIEGLRAPFVLFKGVFRLLLDKVGSSTLDPASLVDLWAFFDRHVPGQLEIDLEESFRRFEAERAVTAGLMKRAEQEGRPVALTPDKTVE